MTINIYTVNDSDADQFLTVQFTSVDVKNISQAAKVNFAFLRDGGTWNYIDSRKKISKGYKERSKSGGFL